MKGGNFGLIYFRNCDTEEVGASVIEDIFAEGGFKARHWYSSTPFPFQCTCGKLKEDCEESPEYKGERSE